MNHPTLEPWMEELLQVGESNKQMTPKQARIFEAAIEIFAEKGYSASSTSEIAQRAGVAEGTIFRHYKTKKDLLLSIVTPAMFKLISPFLLREFRGILKADYTGYDDFLRALIDNRIIFLQQNRQLIKIFIQEIPFHAELQEQFKQQVFAQVKERFDAIIQRCQDAGQMVQLPSLTIIRLTISSVMGYLLSYLMFASKEHAGWDDARERQATIDFIMKGLSPS